MSRPSPFSFPQPTPQDWAQIQDAVRIYYVNQKLPLKEVRTVLRDRHGFRATDRMIKARLKQWGYLKNAKKEDWHFLALLHHTRKERGKSSTVFDVRGHRKTVKDLHRFIRNQNMTADQFLDEARDAAGNKQIPDYIRALTPDSRHYQDLPLDDVSPDYVTPSPPQAPARLRQQSNITSQGQPSRPGKPINHHRPRSTSASSDEREFGLIQDVRQNTLNSIDMQDSAYMSASSTASTCTQLQMEFEMMGSQITRPAPLMSRFGDENICSWALLSNSPSSSDKSGHSVQFVCSRCSQPSDHHFISLDSFEPHQAIRRDILNGDDHTLHLPVSTKDEGSWLWVSRCFLACMCLKRGEQTAADQSLREASKEFEKLIERKDQQLLTAAGLVMTILHMHDQGDIARRVIESAHAVAARMLSKDHPLRRTMRYLLASATNTQREHSITSETLKSICDKFRDYYAPDHEYVIAARHNYSWMLRFEGRWDDAEAEAREVYSLSCKVLGEIHMQSITSLALIGGSMYTNSDRIDECITIFERVVEHAGSSLGRHHPYTLEAKRRMAEKMVERSGHRRQTLQLYKDILWGRVHMLGVTHEYTQGAKEKYEDELKTMQLWVDENGQATPQQQDVEDLFSPNSPGSWTKISRRRTSSQQTLQRPLKNEFDENDMIDEDDELVIVEGRHDGSQSPRSNHEFEAY